LPHQGSWINCIKTKNCDTVLPKHGPYTQGVIIGNYQPVAIPLVLVWKYHLKCISVFDEHWLISLSKSIDSIQ